MFLELVEKELKRSRELHGNLHSVHEALGVLDEEFFEAKLEIYKKKLDKEALLTELVQLAAMCAKTAEDCGLFNKVDYSFRDD